MCDLEIWLNDVTLKVASFNTFELSYIISNSFTSLQDLSGLDFDILLSLKGKLVVWLDSLYMISYQSWYSYGLTRLFNVMQA